MHEAPALPIWPVKVSMATIEKVAFNSQYTSKIKVNIILIIVKITDYGNLKKTISMANKWKL